MSSRRSRRSEETKQSILQAASRLFAAKGFEAVTMREIAKLAGCSHTAIYIYFKDKESLLHALSTPPLLQLKKRMEAALEDSSLSPEMRLKRISFDFIRFCLERRNTYSVLFAVQSGRVDEANPENELNRLRNSLFALLMRAVRDCLVPEAEDSRLLASSRIYFYFIHGIVGTYAHSRETADQLMNRLGATFEEGIEALLSGLRIQFQ